MISDVVTNGVVAVEAFQPGPAWLLGEEDRALGRVAERRRRDYTQVRGCARRALGELGIAPVAILPGPSGAPQWPDGIIGSLTHCPGYWAAAVARVDDVTSIGIDAEVHDRLPPGVLPRIAAPQEQAALARQPDGVCWDRLLFSAKESVYKAWFPVTRRWLGFLDALVDLEPDERTFSVQLLVDAPASGWRLSRFTGRYAVAGGLIVTAVCLPAKRHEPTASLCAAFNQREHAGGDHAGEAQVGSPEDP